MKAINKIILICTALSLLIVGCGKKEGQVATEQDKK